jgi:hypothetical protein
MEKATSMNDGKTHMSTGYTIAPIPRMTPSTRLKYLGVAFASDLAQISQPE